MTDSIRAMSLRGGRLLKAMGNHRRIAILHFLSHGEHSVGQLCDLVGLSQSALSQHLARLRRENLVATRRDAQTVYYSLAGAEVHEVLRILTDLYGGSEASGRATAGGVETAGDQRNASAAPAPRPNGRADGGPPAAG